jgi:hypothetical protein
VKPGQRPPFLGQLLVRAVRGAEVGAWLTDPVPKSLGTRSLHQFEEHGQRRAQSSKLDRQESVIDVGLVLQEGDFRVLCWNPHAKVLEPGHGLAIASGRCGGTARFIQDITQCLEQPASGDGINPSWNPAEQTPELQDPISGLLAPPSEPPQQDRRSSFPSDEAQPGEEIQSLTCPALRLPRSATRTITSARRSFIRRRAGGFALA